MISAVFYRGAGGPEGFRVSGHSGTERAGRDVVCAWVTSAVMQCANDITEIFCIPASVQVRENEVSLFLEADSAEGKKLIAGLRLHLQTIAEDHPEAVKIKIIDGGNNND